MCSRANCHICEGTEGRTVSTVIVLCLLFKIGG